MRNSARLAAGVAIGLGIVAAHADAAATVKIGGAVHHVKIWIPEYYGGMIYADTFDYTVTPFKLTERLISVRARGCNPNSVTVGGNNLYVVCNSDFGGKDQVLVFNATTYAYVKAITGVGTDKKNYFTKSSLIGSVIDKHGNL